MTVLVPLNEGFEGGGTAFWSSDSNASPAGSEPSLVLRPPAGTAIVFAGCMTHAAVAVVAGERCCVVASFSPADEADRQEEG